MKKRAPELRRIALLRKRGARVVQYLALQWIDAELHQQIGHAVDDLPLLRQYEDGEHIRSAAVSLAKRVRRLINREAGKGPTG